MFASWPNSANVATQSSASLIREAVAIYLEARKRGKKDKAFGLWQPKGADGVAYQRKVRAEW